MGVNTVSCSSRLDFLQASAGQCCGCVVAELTPPARSFAGLLDQMAKREIALPVVVITRQPRTSLTVQLMKRGAASVLDDPLSEAELREAIKEAVRLSQRQCRQRIQHQVVRRRLASLSQSERRVMELMVDGMANKVIARRLNVSMRTVGSRRHDVFAKMHCDSLAALVRIVAMHEHGGSGQVLQSRDQLSQRVLPGTGMG
jgi:FixJ family two-component response regulator